MSIPYDLKDYALFVRGTFIGETTMVKPPKFTRKVEEWIGSGMAGPVEITMHLEKMDCEVELRGFSLEAITQFGEVGLGDLDLQLRGAYQRGNDGAVSSVEWLIRGSHKEVEVSESKRSENGTTKMATSITTCTLLVDGVEKIHVDMLAGVERYNGTDIRSDIRSAIGL